MNNPTPVQTNVQTIDLDIDSWLGAPGAGNVVTPSSEPPKPSMLSNPTTDLNFLDKNEGSPSDEQKDTTEQSDPGQITPEETNQLLDGLDNELEEEESKSKAGRPKTEKSALVGFLKKRIEAKEMLPFEDYDEEKQTLDEYLSSLTEKEVEDLWTVNLNNIKESIETESPQKLIESLPEKVQYAVQYALDGGQDFDGLFSALAQVEQMREMDPEKDTDQEYIIRQYLQASQFGNPEEIEDQLNEWKDLNLLEKKAKLFKPKLDKMQEDIVQQKLEQQAEFKKRQQEAAQAYVQNVFQALKPGEINGLKLDQKRQAMLYSGLVQSQYPSINGDSTNLLGHLLEKYQVTEPNYPLIAEALWLLSDPDSYREELRKQGATKKVEQTVKSLKTEQARKNISSYQDDGEEERKPRKLSKPTNIFSRR